MSTPALTAPGFSQIFALMLPAVLVATGLLATTPPAHAAVVSDTVSGMTFTADNSSPGGGATLTTYDPMVGGEQVVIPETVTLDGNSYTVSTIGD